MHSPAAETYLGDATLESLLKEIGTSLSIYEVKAMILGAINSVGMISPTEIVDEISQNPVDETQEVISFADKDQVMRFYGQLLSSWNSLNHSEQAPTIFSPMPKNFNGDEISRVVEARYDELTSFLMFVDADDQIQDFTDEAALNAFVDLQNLEEELYDLLDYSAKNFENCRDEVITLLAKLQSTWEDGFPLIKKQLAVLRLQNIEKLKRQSILTKFNLNPPSKNSPCDCGSGKKFKRCCGIES